MILQEKYNREGILTFLKTFIPDLKKDIRGFNASGLKVTEEIVQLGECSELDLQVFELTHTSANDARVSLSMDGFRVMKNSATYRALIIYRSDNSDDWRLSLLTATPATDETGKVIQTLSNPRRFSYFLGPNAKVNTPYQFLIKQGAVKDFEDLQNRFSVEVVNKEFYKEIAVLFTKLVGGTRKIGNRTKDFEGLLKLPSTNSHQKMQEFAVRLIGRTVFCWFLKKKKSLNDIPLLPDDILSAQKATETNNYYHNILEPLFFEILNKPINQRLADYRTGDWSTIPFLNGGLFEPNKIDYYQIDNVLHKSKYLNTLIIPDDWIVALLEIFEMYNFTIDENTTIDIELSIEPEMLGRIFENLLAEINPETGETARKNTGSYYTPRPIVDYMVDESLKQYLKTNTNIANDKIAELLDYSSDQHSLTEKENIKVIDALDNLKFIDPACGSGAFPMGILQKMLLILQKVDPESIEWVIRQLDKIPNKLVRDSLEEKLIDENWSYKHKMGIIQNSIYGVDIQTIATEISKLRLFLTLIVDESIIDEKPNRNIHPLPNLEFKFVSANSLIGLPKEEQGSQIDISDYDSELNPQMDKLADFREKYFYSSGAEKATVESNFIETQIEISKFLFKKGSTNKRAIALSNWKPFSNEKTDWFDPKLMFGLADGFDIVIANPPYIQLQKALPTSDSLKYADVYKNENYKTFERTGDIYALFYEKGLNLLNKDGLLCFITSNKWMRAKYGKSLRKFLCDKNPLILLDLGPGVFAAATVDTNVLLVENSKPDKLALKALTLTNKERISSLGNKDFTILKDLSEDSWIILSPAEYKLKQKIERIGTPLKDWDININYGIKTGFNEAFIIDGATKDQLIAKDPKSAEIIKPILRGRDIKRYKAEFADKWLISTFPALNINIDNYPAVKEYLGKYLPKIKQTGEDFIDEFGQKLKTRKKTGNEWFETQDQIGYYEEFEKEKIGWKAVGKNLTFSIIKEGEFITAPAAFLTSNYNKYILANLLSTFTYYLVMQLADTTGAGDVMLNIQSLERLIIPRVRKALQEPFEELVDKIIAKKARGEDTLAEERQIDLMVYELYNLTAEEIALVEDSIGG